MGMLERLRRLWALRASAHDSAAENSFAQIHALVQQTRRERGLETDAVAFVHLVLRRVLGLRDDALRAAVTHGRDDGGIDAIHIDRAGAQVPGCDYQAAHIVACDYAGSAAEARRPIARARLEQLAKTWVAIASSTDGGLTLNPPLRARIAALHDYWRGIHNDAPHQIHLVTNREHAGIDATWLEGRMDYYASHFYHYLEAADLLAALGLPAGPPSRPGEPRP
ncbi:MAG TPA: hypothetical protein VLT83_12190 [Opitutaceae bacterium]|nr:hypothetical protein [Opitutaceae bacterium]